MSYRNQKLRDTARLAPCMIQSEDCNRDPETTVWVHSDESEHGKGAGEKANDVAGAWGCSACHAHLPNLPREERIWIMRRGIIRTHLELWVRGLVTLAGYDAPCQQAFKRSSKILPRDLEHFEGRN